MSDAVERARAAAADVVRRLRVGGHDAWLVGGCVRETLLGGMPSDFDVATDAVPARVKELFDRVVPIGERFGVVMVVLDGVPTEVATYRAESGYADGRRPSDVRFSSAEEDVARRDFTINALLMDPETGRVIDHVGGRADLAAGVLRTVGDPQRRFAEDHLRMLRAVRFAARLGFDMEERTLAAVRAQAASVSRLAAERVRDELTKMIVAPTRAAAVRLLDETGLLAHVLPEVSATHGCEQPPDHHPEGDVFVHTMLALEALADDASEAACWATLLHDVGKPDCAEIVDGSIRFHGHDVRGEVMAREIAERLRFSNRLRDDVAWIVRNHLRLRAVPGMKRATLRRLLAEPRLDDLVTTCRADALAGSGDLSHLAALERARADLPPELPAPLVSGRDLEAMGMPPGPGYGPILKRLRDEQLDGRVTSRAEALARLREVAGRAEDES